MIEAALHRRADINLPSNDQFSEPMIIDMLGALGALLCDPLPLSLLQVRADAIYAKYNSAFEQLDQAMHQLARDVRMARFPIFLRYQRRKRSGHFQIYLYWFENGKTTNGPVDPFSFLNEIQIKKFEALQARHVQLQARHLAMVCVREVLNRLNLTLQNSRSTAKECCPLN